MTNITVRVVSDNVCPWCYIGKTRLEKAIALYQKTYPGGKDDTFAVSWHPYYLDPTAPAQGVPIAERMAQRFGAERAPFMQQRLRQIGRADGIDFTYAGRMGNTRDSHRLVQLAKTRGPQVESAVVGALMKSYFEGGGDITSRDMLVEAGVAGGLDREEARRWLDEGSGGEEVDKEVEEAYRKGIRGVPHFTIQGKYEVDGAEDVQVFVQQFVAAKEGATASAAEGESCAL